jgi:cytochrome c556
MRLSRAVIVLSIATMAALGVSVALAAQAKTDEDYDKLMKAVGAANGAMRKAADASAAGAESKKLEALFKDAAAFWTGRSNKEAAEWATTAMNHAAAISKAAGANDTEGVAAAQKQLGGVCQTCHTKYREKTETGYAIKKG